MNGQAEKLSDILKPDMLGNMKAAQLFIARIPLTERLADAKGAIDKACAVYTWVEDCHNAPSRGIPRPGFFGPTSDQMFATLEQK